MAVTISPSDPVNSLSTFRVSVGPSTAPSQGATPVSRENADTFTSSQGTTPASRGDTDTLDIAGRFRSRTLEQSAINNQETASGAARARASAVQQEGRSNQQDLRGLELKRAQLRRDLQQTEASLRLLRGRTTFFKNGGPSPNAARALAAGLSINILV